MSRWSTPGALARLGLVVASLALAGCRSAPLGEPREARHALGPGAVVLEVPAVRQEQSEGCGLACLTALLRFHGLGLDDEARSRFSPERLEREPIAARELRDYLRARGFRVALVHGSLDESRPAGLLGLVRRGLPVVVEVAAAGSHHWGLVVGFDPARRLAVFMDPERGLVGIGYEELARIWGAADRLMLVAAPRAGPS